MAPIFKVASVKRVAADSRASQYVPSQEKVWQVSLESLHFKKTGVDFTFQSEAMADRFTVGRAISVKDLIDVATAVGVSAVQFQVDQVREESRYSKGPLGLVDKTKVWSVKFASLGPGDGVTIALTVPTERQARQYGQGKAFDLQGLVGTYPAPPTIPTIAVPTQPQDPNTDPLVPQWWTITNGGAAGYYTDPGGIRTFYANGTFDHPRDGDWFGIFEPA